jgi:hypothetical protein
MRTRRRTKYVGILDMSEEEFQALYSGLARAVLRYGAMFLLSFGKMFWTLGFRLL